jgi:tRNA(Arg) A34 adenosine deaminase TadA
MEHAHYILQCYQLADEAVADGNHPFGAVLVLDGRVIATAKNQVVTSNDPTRHAEMVLLTTGLPKLSVADASRSVLYSSTEPCMMCAAAIYWSAVSTVVYGCSAAALASATGGDFLAPSRDIFVRGERQITVIGPILEAEGLAKHLGYWKRNTTRA